MQVVKWTSLALIFILSNLVGNIISKKYRGRVRELKELKIAINILETKIKFTYEPLKEIFIQISKTTMTNIKKIFEKASENIDKTTVSKTWDDSINQTRGLLNLNNEDIEILKNMGKMLGKTDVEGQISQIQITSSFLDKQIEKAEEERKKNEKMYKTLGAIAGIAIIIILI